LQSFEGGLVVVSHDRHLIKSVADTLWLVADGKLQEFAGDLDDYQQWLRSRGKTSPPTPAGKTAPGKTAPGKALPSKMDDGKSGAARNSGAGKSGAAGKDAAAIEPPAAKK